MIIWSPNLLVAYTFVEFSWNAKRLGAIWNLKILIGNENIRESEWGLCHHNIRHTRTRLQRDVMGAIWDVATRRGASRHQRLWARLRSKTTTQPRLRAQTMENASAINCNQGCVNASQRCRPSTKCKDGRIIAPHKRRWSFPKKKGNPFKTQAESAAALAGWRYGQENDPIHNNSRMWISTD